MHGNAFRVDANGNLISYADDDDDRSITIQAAQQQINIILAGCNTTSNTKTFTNRAKQECDEFFSPNKNVNCTLLAP